jgi:hypothetical protein
MKKFFTLFLFVAAFINLQAQTSNGFTFIANSVELPSGQSSEEFHVFNVSIEESIIVHTNFQTLDNPEIPASQIYRVTSSRVDHVYKNGFSMTVLFKSDKSSYTASFFINEGVAILTIGQSTFYGAAFDIKNPK